MNIKENNWKIWLIRSTFGIKDHETGTSNYWPNRLPQNICQFTKMFLVSLLSIPFSWMSHLLNLIRRDTDANAWWGIVMQIIGMIAMFASMQPELGNTHSPGWFYEMTKTYSITEKLWFMYWASPIALLSLGISLAVVICAIAFGIIWPVKWCEEKIQEKKRNKRDEKRNQAPPVEETNNWLRLYIRGLKDKYCVKINYIK